jgi:hypothetical protein
MHDLTKVMADEGVRGVLRVLNEGVSHRYTAVYEVRGTVLHNLYVFDKLNPGVRPFQDELLTDSYCDLVWTSQTPVKIIDAAQDPEAKQHAAFAKFKSYCGAPLRNQNGLMWGTLCHFDEASQAIADLQWDRLLKAADFLGEQLYSISSHSQSPHMA